MKFLFVGVGSIGQRHIQNLEKVCQEKGIKPEIVLLRSRKDDRFPNYKTYYSLEESFEERPDAVFITNPTHLHASVALLAAKHSCHLFIEKPLSHNMESIPELLKLVNDKRLVGLVACNLRFNDGLRYVKQLIEENKIGKIISVSAHAGQYLPDWRPNADYRNSYSANSESGGGVILDLIHEIDYVYWLLPDIKKVVSFAEKQSSLQINTEDIAEIILKTAHSQIARIHLNYIQKSYSRGCEIVGEDGIIVWNYKSNTVKYFDSKQEEWRTKEFSNDRNLMYIEEMKHFIECIIERKDPLINIEDGKKVLEIALAAKQSAKEEKVIELN